MSSIKEALLDLRHTDKLLLAFFVSLVLWVFLLAYRSLYIHFIEQTGVGDSIRILFSTPLDIVLWLFALLFFLVVSFAFIAFSKSINSFIPITVAGIR